jgi:hypothetical protein
VAHERRRPRAAVLCSSLLHGQNQFRDHPKKPVKRETATPAVSGRRRKTHVGTVIYSKGEKTYASARVLPSGLLDLMSISIKKLASASAALAGIACCWRVLNP